MNIFSGEVGVKCHQSCLVALVFCTKLYIKLAVSLCSFSQFSFPFKFRTADALVLKVGTLPLSCLFSNILLAIFDILFRSRVIYRFVTKNGPKLTCGRVFQHKAKQKKVSASTNPTDRVLKRRPDTFFRLRVRYILAPLRAWPVASSIAIAREKSTRKNQAKGRRSWLLTQAFEPRSRRA